MDMISQGTEIEYFDTQEECCDAQFDEGKECIYEDVCETRNPTPFPITLDPTRDPTPGPTRIPTRNPTRKPTDQPSLSPTLSPTTPSPTTCEERKWHYSPQIDGCANADDMDPDDEMAFDTLEKCCEAEFGTEACDSYDICTPTALPSSSPATPSPTPCEERKWRPKDDFTMCTNAGESVSNDTPLGGFYETLQECCDEIFGDEACMYEDICNTFSPTRNSTPNPTQMPSKKPTDAPTDAPTESSASTPTTPAPTSCEERKWRPNDDSTMCTNAGESVSNDIPRDDAYVTLQECCENIFESGESCEYEDICNPSILTDRPTPEPTPAPTTCRERTWHIHSTKTSTAKMCTNGYETPESETGITVEYNNLDQCCEAEFEGGKCMYNDICVTSPSPSVVTAHPTFGSTPTVSKETTGPPTMFPDRAPRWDSDGHDNPIPLKPNTDKCQQAERETCCNQPDNRSEADKAYICDVLGCNLKKCSNRADGS